MWEHKPKLVRRADLVLFLEVMLCSGQLAAGLGLGEGRTSRWYTKMELILVSVEP